MTRPPTVAEILELHRKNARLLAENKSLREDGRKMLGLVQDCIHYGKVLPENIQNGANMILAKEAKEISLSLSNSYE